MLERTAEQRARELERRVAAFVGLLEPQLIFAFGGMWGAVDIVSTP
jgi:hypothetical protein